ncbi:MAG TPA: helix-turn-helix transcriptional regulator [Acidimicrobiales bacterium]
MTAVSPEDLRTDLIALAHRGLDVGDYARAAARLLGRTVPFEGFCLLTLDPATLLPTGEIVENGLPPWAMPRMTEIELAEDDFNKFTALSRASRSASSLSEATGGDLDKSRRHRELKGPLGFGDELRVALVAGAGTWGAITLLREAGDQPFTPTDSAVVGSVAAYLTEGLRRAILLTVRPADGPGETESGADGPGVLLVARDGSIEMADATARRWLAELDGDTRQEGDAPPVIAAVAQAVRQAAAGQLRELGASARVRTPSGRWLMVRGSQLGEEPDARAAVILEPVAGDELAPLVADAYGFTEREWAVTRLVARGLATNEIASQLHLSPYTVQDHLKSIFDKVGVRTRGELVSRIFFEHYAPRFTSWDALGRAN